MSEIVWREFQPGDGERCHVFWGSHACDRPRGHEGPHLCLACWEPGEEGWVGAPPYYGPETRFFGEDVKHYELSMTPGAPGAADTKKEEA